jgi:hypothetical protein
MGWLPLEVEPRTLDMGVRATPSNLTMDEKFTVGKITEIVLAEECPLQDRFDREELWCDDVNYNRMSPDRLDFIAFVSNWPHPEISATEAKQLKEYLERTVIDEAERQYPKGKRAQIYLPSGPIEAYWDED